MNAPTTTPPDLLPVLHALAGRVRAAGVDATPDRVHAFVHALDALGAGEPQVVVRAGRATLCGDPTDIVRYDRVMAELFGGVRARQEPRTVLELVQSVLDDDAATPPGGEREQEPDAALVANASRVERLRTADIADLSPADRADLHRLLAAFRLPGATRRTRRHQPWHAGGIDRRATTRALLSAGGEPARIARRRPRRRSRDVVVLADVSGSMAPYAEAMLRFAHAASRGRDGRTEVFTLGTRLTRVTRELGLRDPDQAMRAVGRAVPDWSGGTRLGAALRAFLDGWGQRGTARGAVVAVLSDGWELGDTTLLGEQAARLARLAHRVVWANPRAGRPGFAPTAAGMVAVLPSCDALLPANTAAALEDVAGVVAGARGHVP